MGPGSGTSKGGQARRPVRGKPPQQFDRLGDLWRPPRHHHQPLCQLVFSSTLYTVQCVWLSLFYIFLIWTFLIFSFLNLLQLTYPMEWEPSIGVIIRLRTGLLTLVLQQHRLWQQLPMNPSQSCAHHWRSPSADMLVLETEYMNISLPGPHLRQCQNVPIESQKSESMLWMCSKIHIWHFVRFDQDSLSN